MRKKVWWMYKVIILSTNGKYDKFEKCDFEVREGVLWILEKKITFGFPLNNVVYFESTAMWEGRRTKWAIKIVLIAFVVGLNMVLELVGNIYIVCWMNRVHGEVVNQ